jgi:hypothetical protein
MNVEQFRDTVSKKIVFGKTQSEHAIQVSCIRYFRTKYPQYLIYAIPNGSYKSKTAALQMRAEGLTSGICDLHIPIARKGYNSFYIEMKKGKKGVLSENQKIMIERLRSYGNKVSVCRSLDDFIKEVDEYFS